MKTASVTRVLEYLNCQRKYEYRYVQGLKPRSYQRALEFGSIGHKVLEEYYESGLGNSFSVPAVIESIREERGFEDFDAFSLQAFEEDLAKIEGMLKAYIKHYHEKDSGYKILFTEKAITMDEPISEEVDWHFMGIPDLCVMDKAGKVWIWDHKFLSRADDNLIRKLPLDMQINGYQVLTRQWLDKNGYEDAPIAGVVYNIIKKSSKRLKKKQTKEELILEMVMDYTRSPSEFFFREPIITSSRHRRFFLHTMNETVKNIKQSEKTDTYVMNPSQCSTYGLCPFFDLCVDGEKALHLYETREERK